MRDLFKFALIGIALFFIPQVFAEEYKVLVLPDNIVAESASLDSYIYDATSEFFADGISNILNNTDYIKSMPVSSARATLKSENGIMFTAKNLTERFKNSYNVDYDAVKKVANKTNNRYVLLLTSTIDAQNFILRRTWWDFFNIPGASVIDPAYKINTYAVLIDTTNNTKLWDSTYYKTISTVENRIISQGPSPQNVQLEKIKDYSNYLCPEIAQRVQLAVLPRYIYAKESKQIDCTLGNFDNIFTKKYRNLRKESFRHFRQQQDTNKNFIDKNKSKKSTKKTKKTGDTETKLEVKATPVYKKQEKKVEPVKENKIQNINYVKNDNSGIDPIEIKKTRKNNLYGNYDSDRPILRDYY